MKINKCPFCNEKLIHGYIKTNGEIIAWSPNSKKKSIFTSRWGVKENEIQLGEYKYFTGGKVSAFRCDKCNRIIIDMNYFEV